MRPDHSAHLAPGRRRVVGFEVERWRTTTMNEKLAFQAQASTFAFGPGGHVTASFLCATPEKAYELVKVLEALAKDAAPEWAKAKTDT